MSTRPSKDDFAGRAEYGGQMHKFSGTTSQNGAFLVAKTVRAKVTPRLSVQGFVNYRGEWHYYDTAILKGGETVELANIKRDVLSCRYGCSYSESFILFPTKEQIAKYGENGVLPIQVRGRNSGNTFILNVPLSDIMAIEEVAK